MARGRRSRKCNRLSRVCSQVKMLIGFEFRTVTWSREDLSHQYFVTQVFSRNARQSRILAVINCNSSVTDSTTQGSQINSTIHGDEKHMMDADTYNITEELTICQL